jgi:Lon protease-like protein
MIRLPLFPLNTILFPEGVLPLRIFETRYLDMVRNGMRSGQASFVVVPIVQGHDTSPTVEFLPIGTRAEIIDWEQRPDGLLGIVALGKERLRILSHHTQADGLLVGEGEPLPEWPAVPLPLRYAPLADLLQRLIGQLGSPWNRQNPRLDDSAWVVGRLTEWLPLDLALKQALLREDDPLERLRQLYATLLQDPEDPEDPEDARDAGDNGDTGDAKP